jgi:hypothetical protein
MGNPSAPEFTAKPLIQQSSRSYPETAQPVEQRVPFVESSCVPCGKTPSGFKPQ